MKFGAIVVEGQTEERFVNEVLNPYLADRGLHLQVCIVETSRAASGAKHKGGGSWAQYERDVRRLLGATHFVCVTTMIDFYAYPSDGPGADCARPHTNVRACHASRLEAMARTVESQRFVPYVSLHEFETLVFAAALAHSALLGDEAATTALRRHAQEVADDVELLNDDPATAPSKRLEAAWPEYVKVVDGVDALKECSFDDLVDRCPALGDWIGRLLAMTVD